MKPSNAAFTLIELSVVLVIVGLVIGSILIGQTLVRSAQLRNVASEYDSYLQGIKEFQDKYLALPGDMNNATSLWGVTANGDGSGTIGTSNTTGAPSNTAGSGGSANAGEWYLAWQHLALAGFIPGRYSGTSTDGVTAIVGSNVPASKLAGAGWSVMFYINTSGNAGLWSDQYGHIMSLGGGVAGSYARGAVLTPAEALSIDTKLDDGLPGTGKIRAWRTSVLPNCTTSDTSQTAQAYSANSGIACSLVFLLGY